MSHPHCRLEFTRNVAPLELWHWAVRMPDEHIFDVSSGFTSAELALADPQALKSLLDAERAWSWSHPGYNIPLL